MTTPRLALPEMSPSQNQKHVTFNESMYRLEGLVQSSVINRTTTAPPGSPADGDSYIIASPATGVWAGKETDIATYFDGQWYFAEPSVGFLVYDAATTVHVKWNGTSWVSAFAASTETFGWVDFQDTATASTPIALTVASTWYDVTNDGLGALTDDTFGITDQGDVWDTSTNTLDFSGFQVGDLFRFRTDWTFTTSGANHDIKSRLVFGPSYSYSLDFDSQTVKSAGSAQRLRYWSFTIKTADVRDNPAKLQVLSDSTGDSVTVEGFQIEVHRP